MIKVTKEKMVTIQCRIAECGGCNLDYARNRLRYPLEAFGVSPYHFSYVRSLSRLQLDLLLNAILESFDVEKGTVDPEEAY